MDTDRTVTDETIFNLYWAYYGRERAMQFWRTVTDAARDSGLDQKRRAGNRGRDLQRAVVAEEAGQHGGDAR